MSRRIIHIVGLDERNKSYLCEYLASQSVFWVDLDAHQDSIHNSEAMQRLKKRWSQWQLRIRRATSKHEIQNYKHRRRLAHDAIYRLWHTNMRNVWNNIPNRGLVVVIGFNVHPKDYRQYLPIMANQKIFVNFSNTEYAANQIQWYLQKYHKQIAYGRFPLKLLDASYVKSRHDKFSKWYLSYRKYELTKIESIAIMLQNIVLQICGDKPEIKSDREVTDIDELLRRISDKSCMRDLVSNALEPDDVIII